MLVPWGAIVLMTELDRRIRAVFFDLDKALLDNDRAIDARSSSHLPPRIG